MKRINDDTRAFGGNLASGLRLVRKGGNVRFDSWTFQHDKLLPFVGQLVRVAGVDDAFYPLRARITKLDGITICHAHNTYRD